MTAGWEWKTSPIVVLPLTAVTFALVACPFIVAKTDYAFAFYGAFLAAIIAALALIFNSRYANWLEQQKELRATRQFQTERALYVWSFISRAQAYLGGVLAVYDGANYQTVGAAQPHDLTSLTVGQFRAALEWPKFKYDEAAAHCVTLDPQIAVTVTRAVNLLALTMNDVLSFPWSPPDTNIWRENVRTAANFARNNLVKINEGSEVLAAYLRERKYIA